MNLRLYLQTLRWNQVRLLAVVVASIGWGMLIPIIYVQFAALFKDLANSSSFPRQFLNFGSGSIFTLPGAMTMGLQHPLAIAFVGIFAIGSTTGAVAGERERGTLEVLLARPISRRQLYVTLAAASATLIAIVMLALLGGQMIGVVIQGVGNELQIGWLPLVFLNGVMLWAAFAAFGLAASVSFDRHGPAIGLTMGYVLVNYFLEILGSLWRDVSWSQQYSLFHHFNPGKILTGQGDPLDFLILAVAIVLPVAYALVVFPRRDLAAPS